MSEVFDRQELSARAMDDPDLVRAVVDGFLEDFPLQIEDLKAAFASGDAETMARRLHAMKGVAATVSAGELRRCAVTLEALVKEKGVGEEVRGGISRLEDCFARLAAEMRT